MELDGPTSLEALTDFVSLLERAAPRNAHYRHNDFSVRTVPAHHRRHARGRVSQRAFPLHSHCQHLTLGTSETLPVIDGALPLGQWQRIFMVELDDQKIRREVLVQIMGV